MKKTQGLARSKTGSYGRKWRMKSWKSINGWRRIRFPVKTVVRSTKNTERTPRSVNKPQRGSAFSELMKCIRSSRADDARLILRLEDNYRKIDSLHQYIAERITNLERLLDNELQKSLDTEEEVQT